MKPLQLNPRGFDLKTAAKHLGISHHALTSALRDRGILQPSGHGLVPNPAHASQGYFGTEARQVQTDGPTGRITRHYVVTLVTIAGLAWLQNELRSAA